MASETSAAADVQIRRGGKPVAAVSSTPRGRIERVEALLEAHPRAIACALVICGFLWRLHYASGFYLNPDEAFHYWVAAGNWHGWRELASMVAHPPVFFLVLREIVRCGRSEWLLRLVPMAAGAVFPWFVMLWVRRFSSDAAALSAQLFLTFSPTLVDLSTEVRGYSLAFLFLSISLVLLEEALDRDSKVYIGWFHLFLYLAILTEYSVAWFVGALGLYALLRLWRQNKSQLWVAWLSGQVGAMALYAFLAATQVSTLWPGNGTVDGWLRTEFLQPGQHIITFALRGSLSQFKYEMGIHRLGVFAALVFLFGLFQLCRKGKWLQAMLLVVPFCLACLGAVFDFFPYGATRHTAVLAIAVAAGIGSTVGAITRNRILPIILVALLMVPMWNWFAEDSYFPVSHDRRSLSQMTRAVQFLLSSVPAKTAVVTDEGTYYMLAYYLNSHDDTLAKRPYGPYEAAGLHFIVAPTFRFTDDTALRQFLSEARHGYNLKGPVWVATGGYDIQVTNPAFDAGSFEKIIAIFESPDSLMTMPGFLH